eukprot:CAMPEP_0118882890 /NCGR_PEP_ID=MMETSP1163-20130328/22053_1 /TAXON_ID=124430 /ORGANISM="Phaeomonas parva, Strain CCMP2877" /LENGTH=64 /DNA_ID=CAMNT_0006820107 /DNA_START=108 /DNA_END=300 /DNA_ORIENTATION=-
MRCARGACELGAGLVGSSADFGVPNVQMIQLDAAALGRGAYLRVVRASQSDYAAELVAQLGIPV